MIPVVILAGYQFLTYKLYGRGLLLDAASYATKRSWVMDIQLVTKGFVSLAFMGGCVLTALFFVPLLWSRRCIFVGALITIFVCGGLIALEKSGAYSVKTNYLMDLSLWYLVSY